MPKSESIVEYYDWKVPEYTGKYLLEGRAHAHVGLFDKREEPEVFRRGWISPDLGIDRLKHLMHRGQDRTVTNLVRTAQSRLTGSRALDCGAGLGGTAMMLSERFRLEVDALTISPAQYEYMNREVSSGWKDLSVRPILGDVFEKAWWPRRSYDLITGIDAFCQIGRLDELFKILHSIQTEGGVLAISDHYAADANSPIANYYNDYWVSEISTPADLFDGLDRAGYRIRHLEDLSEDQLPYWQLSVAYSQLPADDRSDGRRSETLAFHSSMRDAYVRGDMRYLQVVATRRH